jgi:hypothetical protein
MTTWKKKIIFKRICTFTYPLPGQRNVRSAIVVNVFANFDVGLLTTLDWNWDAAERADWDLNITLGSLLAIVSCVRVVLIAVRIRNVNQEEKIC